MATPETIITSPGAAGASSGMPGTVVQPAPGAANPANVQIPNVGLSAALKPAGVGDMNVSDTARGLFQDPTSAFQPSLDFINKQRSAAGERYAQNKADIANIFGNLTQVNRESQNRVNEQFSKSIADQQMATAERVAQARMGQQQTQESAVRAMDERGGGPMGNLLASPVAREAERGIADQNAYQSIWEGQQGAIRAQTEQDLLAANRGLGFQEVLAGQTLQRSLENTLNQLSGQETGIRSELAQAIVGARGQVAQANYNEVLSARAAEEARRLAAVRGAYSVEQAAINAQNKIDLANINAQNRVQNYSADAAGVSQFMRREGADDKTIGRFWATVDSTDYANARNPQEAYDTWLQSNLSGKARQRSGISEAERIAARMYFDGLRYTGPSELSVVEKAMAGTAPNTAPPRR